MGTITSPRPASPTSPSAWPTVGVGAACLVLGLVIGRVTAPTPALQPVVPSPAAPSASRAGAVAIASAVDTTATLQNATQVQQPISLPPSAPAAAPAPAPVAPSFPSVPVSATPIPIPDLSNAEMQLKAFCSAKWPTDFSMQAYCQQQQREAVAKLLQPGPYEVPYEAFATIRAKCASKWTEDFTMRAYCEAEQVKGYAASR